MYFWVQLIILNSFVKKYCPFQENAANLIANILKIKFFYVYLLNNYSDSEMREEEKFVLLRIHQVLAAIAMITVIDNSSSIDRRIDKSSFLHIFLGFRTKMLPFWNPYGATFFNLLSWL